MRTCEGYASDWDDQDQIGTYEAMAGGDQGEEPIESFVLVGYGAEMVEAWAVLDLDADWEGPGVVSTHATREEAVTAAEEYLRAHAQ